MTRKLVLCVDDEPAVLASLRRALSAEAYEVVTTTDPLQALAWVETGNVALVLADHRMPHMTGVELLREIRRRSPQTATIMLTGYPSEALSPATGTGPEVCLMSKPWDNEDLRRLIRDRVSRA
jgi:CheY-like chemotaxis protein